MDDTTAKILQETKEELRKEITEDAVRAMADRAADAAFLRYLEQVEAATQKLNEARESLAQEVFNARTQIMSATADYITREEAERQAKEQVDKQFASWRTNFDTFTDDFNKESARRNQVLDLYMAEVKAVAVESQQKSIDNEKQIAAANAANDERFKQFETRLTKAETRIEGGVAKVEKNSTSMHRMVGDWITQSKTRDEKNDTIIKELKAGQELLTVKVTDLESKAQGAIDLAEDVDNRVGRNIDKLNYAILGNKETKTEGLVDVVQSIREDYQRQMLELRGEQTAINKRQQAYEKSTWYLTAMGDHPYRTMMGFSTIIILILITIAGIFGRPDIVEAIVRAAK